VKLYKRKKLTFGIKKKERIPREEQQKNIQKCKCKNKFAKEWTH
jgi:hypothetical protein